MYFVKNDKNIKLGSEGSSLAIALFFFMICALLCAGTLFLANSTTRGVSKSYSYAESQTFVAPPTPSPTPTPIPTPEPGPEFANEVAAIDTLYSNLNYDFLNACITADAGGMVSFPNTPSNMTYEILSYIHSYYGKSQVPVSSNDGGSISVLFTYNINGVQVEVLVEMKGTDGSQANNGLRFHNLKMTVGVPESTGCTYKQVVEYTVNNGKDGKLYFRWSSSGGKHFELKNA